MNDDDFVWNVLKAAANLRKHGVSLEEAATVFRDPLALTISDPEHSADKERWIIMGLSDRYRLVLVVHVERGSRIRIISARKATRQERQDYEEW